MATSIADLEGDALNKVLGHLTLAELEPVRRASTLFRDAAQHHPAMVALTDALEIPATYSALHRYVGRHATTRTQRRVWQLHLTRGSQHFGVSGARSLREAAQTYVQITQSLERAVERADLADMAGCAQGLRQALSLSGGCGYRRGLLDVAGIKARAYARLIETSVDRAGAAHQAPLESQCVWLALLNRMQEAGRSEAFGDSLVLRRRAAARLAAVWADRVPRLVGREGDSAARRKFMAVNAHIIAARVAEIRPALHVQKAWEALTCPMEQSNTFFPPLGPIGDEALMSISCF